MKYLTAERGVADREPVLGIVRIASAGESAWRGRTDQK
jgi:hypothetical protein